MLAELEKSEEGGRATLFIKSQTCCVKGMGSPTGEILANGEEDVTMRQDTTATGGASLSSASRGPAVFQRSRYVSSQL